MLARSGTTTIARDLVETSTPCLMSCRMSFMLPTSSHTTPRSPLSPHSPPPPPFHYASHATVKYPLLATSPGPGPTPGPLSVLLSATLHNDTRVRAATAPLLTAYLQSTGPGLGSGTGLGSGLGDGTTTKGDRASTTSTSLVLGTLLGWVEGWADALVVGVAAKQTGAKGTSPSSGADDDLAGIGRLGSR